MTDKVQKDRASSTDLTRPEPGETLKEETPESFDTPSEMPLRPQSRREFPIVQYSITVPKPSYYRDLEADANGLNEADQSQWSDPGALQDSEMYDKGSAGHVDPTLRDRRRKIRLWIFFLLVVLLYGVVRTLRFMH